MLVREGLGRIESDGRSFPLAPGHLVFIPPGCDHRLVEFPLQQLSLLVLWIRDRRLQRYLCSHLIEDQVLVLQEPKLMRHFHTRMRRMLYEQQADLPGADLLCAGVASQLIAEFRRWRLLGKDLCSSHTASDEHRVLDYLGQLDLNLHLPESLHEAAHRTGVSRRRFSAIVRKLTGESWHRFVRNRRMEYAGQLLRSNERPIMEISFMCGYEDLSSFYRNFRRCHGVSPQQYRQRSR
ncbi:MAG: AraC family transcriptional regulator [Puniceicoccaceae bacterium 5H]|nr:MAG: AraC family transcriptional regulator [Puniceicoccaceae bacterium 5H]